MFITVFFWICKNNKILKRIKSFKYLRMRKERDGYEKEKIKAWS